jgi:hypothetical protein
MQPFARLDRGDDPADLTFADGGAATAAEHDDEYGAGLGGTPRGKRQLAAGASDYDAWAAGGDDAVIDMASLEMELSDASPRPGTALRAPPEADAALLCRQRVLRVGLGLCLAVFAVSVFHLVSTGGKCQGPGPVAEEEVGGDGGVGRGLLPPLKLRVHMLRSRGGASAAAPQLNAVSSSADAARFVAGANAIWEPQAGIRVQQDGPAKVLDVGAADAQRFAQALAATAGMPPAKRNPRVAAALQAVRGTAGGGAGSGGSHDGWDLFLVGWLPFCGMASSAAEPTGGRRGAIFVRESGCARISLDASAGSLPDTSVIMAHELGHTLGLVHTPGDCGVMSVGAAGVAIDGAQASVARAVMRAGTGGHSAAGWTEGRRRLHVMGEAERRWGRRDNEDRWLCRAARLVGLRRPIPFISCFGDHRAVQLVRRSAQ